MWRCLTAPSRLLAMKRVDEIRREGFKEIGRDFKLSFGEANRALGFAVRWQWTNFRNRNIPLAQKYGFSPTKLCEVTRKMSFCFMNVQPNHGDCLA